MRAILVVLLLSVALSGVQAADLKLVMESEEENRTSTVLIGHGNVKIMSDDGWMIFLGKERAVIIADPSDRSYFLLDEAQMQQMANAMQAKMPSQQEMNEMNQEMAEAMKKMEESLAKMPKEQADMARKLMKDKLPQPGASPMTQPGTRPETRLVQTGQKEKHAGKPCVLYEVRQGENLIGEIWATDWKHVGARADDFQPVRDMALFMQEMTRQLPQAPGVGGGNVMACFDQLDGCPIVVREIHDGEVTTESVTKSVEKVETSAADFGPPAGFERKQPFSMP